MELQFYGGNAIVINIKNRRFIFDNWTASKSNDKMSIKPDDVEIFTEINQKGKSKLYFNSPGEYEVSDISIVGIQSKAFKESEVDVTMFKIISNDFTILITGNINPNIPDNVLEKIGIVDVLIVPAGGMTLVPNPNDVLKIIKSIEPKIIVPTYYKTKENSGPDLYEIEDIISELGMEVIERNTKIKLKNNELSDKTQLIILDQS